MMDNKSMKDSKLIGKSEYMEYGEFIKKVKNGLSAYFGKDTKVTLKKVNKNNGVILDGIIILGQHEMIAPTIYLESFYMDYLKGKSLGDIIMEIIAIYEQNRVKENIDLDFFMKYEAVKGRIFQKVINYQKNEKRLQKVPHIRFLDLAIVCYFAYMNDFLGNGSIQIEKEHLQEWGISEEELFENARKNTIEKLGVELRGMDEILLEMLSDSIEKDAEEETQKLLEHMDNGVPMYVMTLRGRFFGATCICYQEFMEKFAKKCKKDFYILPSSIHELILVPDSGKEKASSLKSMVQEVNATHVSEEEQLSDNVYFYNSCNNEIVMI